MHDIAREVEKLADDLGIDRKRSIGEVAKELKIETHIIRFWEEKFPQIKPEIGAGKRRYYYSKQLRILKKIKKFLYEDGYTSAGLQKLLKQRKHNDHKEEDLDVILNTNFSDEEKSMLFSADLFEEKPAHKKPESFTLNDFISGDEISPDLVIEVENSMSEEDKIAISESLDSAKETLKKLKSLLSY